MKYIAFCILVWFLVGVSMTYQAKNAADILIGLSIVVVSSLLMLILSIASINFKRTDASGFNEYGEWSASQTVMGDGAKGTSFNPQTNWGDSQLSSGDYKRLQSGK